VTQCERAAQMWSVLALAARNHQVLTYRMLGRLTGVPAGGLGRCLDPTQSYCLLHNLEPLTVLVVYSQSGVPGPGFVGAENVPAAQQRVFAYDWLDHRCPAPEQFEEALVQQPPAGNLQVEDE
jgi:putative restriction endonuclease